LTAAAAHISTDLALARRRADREAAGAEPLVTALAGEPRPEASG